MQSGDAVLNNREIRNAEHPDAAVAPGLRGEPRNGVGDFADRTIVEIAELAARPSGATNVHNDVDVATPDEEVRIAGLDVGNRHGEPNRRKRRRLIRFRIGVNAEDDRKFSRRVGPENVAVECFAGTNRDRYVAIVFEAVLARRKNPIRGEHFVLQGRLSARAPTALCLSQRLPDAGRGHVRSADL